MKALKIISCDCPRKWYSNKIGQHVVYLGFSHNEWESRDDGGYRNFISKDDAELVDINEENS